MTISQEKLQELLESMESERIERTISTKEDKLGPAVCALSNDFSNSQQTGYILLGVNDDRSLAGMRFSDKELQSIGGLKTNGNILPQPSIVVSQVFHLEHGEVVILEVKPSTYPPVRYNGRCWIRIGPRKSKASLEEENILISRRASHTKGFDMRGAQEAELNDLALEYFRTTYLQAAINSETLQENGRNIEQQLASLRFFDSKTNCPTNAGILVLGLNPEYFIPGAYIQYVKFDSEDMLGEVVYEKKFSGALISELNTLNSFIKNNIIKTRPVRNQSFQEDIVSNYPFWAMRELLLNAIMHRNYESNAPIYIYEFTKSIEILNPGGLFGDVNAQNFPNTSDYRNIVLAEALKVLGYVNKFNYGVNRAKEMLEKNGNPEPSFDFELITKFKVSIPIHSEW